MPVCARSVKRLATRSTAVSAEASPIRPPAVKLMLPEEDTVVAWALELPLLSIGASAALSR